MHTCTHAHILTYSHTHILTYSHTHILTYSHTHIHTYTHTSRAPVGSHQKSLNPSGHRNTIVFSTQDALGLSESCSRLSAGYISGTRLLRIVLSPQSWPHFVPL